MRPEPDPLRRRRLTALASALAGAGALLLAATAGAESAVTAGGQPDDRTAAVDATGTALPQAVPSGTALPDWEWPEWGRDSGGTRYSPLAEIRRDNVARLVPIWTHRHGDVAGGEDVPRETAFEVTPIVVEGGLYYCTPFNRVFALDAESGAERWVFDPKLDLGGRYANQAICRGVSTWLDAEREAGAACRRRILTATNDGRLFALDAATGRPCTDFGSEGRVDLKHGVGEERWLGEYQVTSAPVVAGDVVVVGSAVSDGQRTDAPSGVVRGYDVRTGRLRWAFDLAPPGSPPPPPGEYTRGTPNVWAPMSADPERDLVFVPTGNPAPDYYRGGLGPVDHYGSSVLALRASTGAVVWRFQTVHHDLWDFDVPSQPTLFTLRRDGAEVPALVQPTKMGFLFVLHRETGEPLFPVEERPVPQDGAPGEPLSATQPFPVKPPPLVRQSLRPEDAWGVTPFDRAWCRRRIEELRNDGAYTPPSLQGSLMYPGNVGGSNWGSIAFHPGRALAIANVSDLPWTVRLIPRERFAEEKAANPDGEVAPQDGVAYAMTRSLLLSPLGLPCNPPPWGTLAAVDLQSGEIRWQVPLGTVRDIAPIPIPWKAGVPNSGGPLVTGSGLIFIGAAMDDYLRAFDIETGEELWAARLPAGGQATPMTYRAREGGRQIVVIAAGGHARAGTTLGDHVVAFALPD
jgi:quinoprotein glucose dehydrogenase